LGSPSNGHNVSTISTEEIMVLLEKMEEANLELQTERDAYLKAVYAWAKSKFDTTPLPLTDGPVYDIDELIQELEGK
jgi:hypothetical protein